MKKFLIPLLILLVFAFVLIGCSSSGTTVPTKAPSTTIPAQTATSTTNVVSSPTTAPQSGGILKIISVPGIQNLGYPGKAFFPADQALARCAVQYLFNRDPKTSDYVGELATSWQWGADYKTLTLNLRKGVKFQDGTDFNADAAIFNLNLHWKGIRSDLQAVTSMDKVDDYTVRLNLKGYDSSLSEGLASLSGFMVSPTSLQKLGDEALLHPVGTGPFKFVSYTPDISLKFEKFAGYWESGKPYLDGIEWVFVKEAMTQVASFKAGEAQVLRSIDVNGVLDFQSKGTYNIQSVPGRAIGIAGDGGHANSVFSNIKVRQALAYAIDNEALAKALGRGLFKSSNQWSIPGSGGLPYNPDIKGYPYNVAKAKQLLSEAGYPNGFETKIILQSTDPQPDMMTMVQNSLQAAGITAKLDVADAARFNELAAKGWNNGLIYYWMSAAPGIDPGTSVRSKMCSKSTHYDPKSVFIPAEFDAKFWLAVAEPDPVKKKASFLELGRQAVDDYAIGVPIYMMYGFSATAQGVHDFDLGAYGVNEWRPENAWLSK
jgi:peptide/nickel transport system substrate-binding protein